jgi:hypothetical protein
VNLFCSAEAVTVKSVSRCACLQSIVGNSQHGVGLQIGSPISDNTIAQGSNSFRVPTGWLTGATDWLASVRTTERLRRTGQSATWAACFPRLSDRQARITCAPLSANSSAVARPRPAFPPVMTHTCKATQLCPSCKEFGVIGLYPWGKDRFDIVAVVITLPLRALRC